MSKSQQRIGARWRFTFTCDNCGDARKTYNQVDRAGFSPFAVLFPQAKPEDELPEHLCPRCSAVALEGAMDALDRVADEQERAEKQARAPIDPILGKGDRQPPREPRSSPRMGPKSLEEEVGAIEPEANRTGPREP
ncbi:MAG: hypothetical protein P8Y27_05005 [Chromatiaceae bacterium]